MPMDERLGPQSSTPVNISVRDEDRMLMTAKRFGQQDSPAATTARTPVAPRGTEKRLSWAK
jgi:hypothetical protein